MSAPVPARAQQSWEGAFAGALGLWLGLALLKFGNPVILDQKIATPVNREELIYQAWPVWWGYALLAGVALLATRVWRWKIDAPHWVIVLPLAWLGCQFLSATQTIDGMLTAATVKHFTACVVAFCLGLFALSRVQRESVFWLGLLGGFVVVLAVGLEQHFGGLERTRKFFFEQPDWQRYSPEFLKKISSNRIFSTLVYPNALAGAILLLGPMLLAGLGQATTGRPRAVRIGLVTVAGAAAGGCLYWSGSKAGWLIALAQGTVAFLRAPLSQRLKIISVIVVAAGGLALFAVKYGAYFQGGATSASARIDYWEAAWKTFLDKPLLGSGPGTFMISYRSLKRPESEMARLAHNDYLQQASDSGGISFLAYGSFWIVSLVLLYRRSRGDPLHEALWLGLAGMAVQSAVEFGLYIPGLAWPAFVLLGWAWGRRVRGAGSRTSRSAPNVGRIDR